MERKKKKRRKKKEGRQRGNEGNDLSRASAKQATLYCIRSFSTRQMAFPFLFITFFLTPPLLPPLLIPGTTERNERNNDVQAVIIFPSVLMDLAFRLG